MKRTAKPPAKPATQRATEPAVAPSSKPESQTAKPIPAPRPNPDWERRKVTAAKYRPKTVKLLLVTSAPPAEGDFYDEDAAFDPLFEDLAQVLFEEPPVPGVRAPYLEELKRRGVFLVELKPDAPREPGESLAAYADWLPTRLDVLEPAHILLVDAATHDAALEKLEKAGLPVETTRIGFGSGDRKDARGRLRTALVRAGLEKMIRELPPKARERVEASRSGGIEVGDARERVPSLPATHKSRPPGKRTPDSSR